MRPEAVDSAAGIRPYFLCVATIEPRKNVDAIIEAWREVRQTDSVDLVLAGRVRDGQKPPPIEPGLRFLGSVPDRELPALYSRAVAALYPSIYEGFGLPVLEAMQCGAAVVTSRDPAVLETAGKATLTADAKDPRQWAAAMKLLLGQPDARREWQGRSLQRASEFSWGRTAIATRAVYDQAIERFRGA
jgi:glycosyltransferase involved in cell wall biosynthesis